MNKNISLKKIRKILKDNDFEFIRRNKHEIWKHKIQGTKVVFGTSPRDAETQLKIILWKIEYLKKNNFVYQPSNKQVI